MRQTFSGVGRWVAAALVAVGAGCFLGASGAAAWDGTAAQAGVHFYARIAELGRRIPLGFLLPIIAMTVSFHAGSQIARRMQKRSTTRLMSAPRRPVVHYAILFSLGTLFAIVYAAARGLL